MNTHTISGSETMILQRTCNPRWQDAARALLSKAWQGWRERQLRRSRWLMLEELSDARRRDLGIAEWHVGQAASARPLDWRYRHWL